jgi:Reverse transcriptase (RNA-dependent DNA polymerase)
MLKFLIVDLGRDWIIFGYPWLWEFNPEIDWPTKYIKGLPFLAADAMIEPNNLINHVKQFTRRRYLNPNGWAFIWHLPREYEDDNPPLGTMEEHTVVTTFQPREMLPAPTPPEAQKRIQKELNWVEKYLDLTKTVQTKQMLETDNFPNEDFTKITKERQAQYVMKTQFTPPPLLKSPPIVKLTPSREENRQQEIEAQIESSPLTKLTQLKEENWQWRITTQLDSIEQHLTQKSTPQLPPTPLETPPPKALECFQMLRQTLEVNRMTAATQWAIDASKSTIPERTELPPHYHQHWHIFSKKLAQHFPPTRKDNHAIKLRPGAPDTIPSHTYKWTPEEDKVGWEWLKENEDLRYIKKGNSPWATPCFFVKKKDGKLQPVQDYQVINKWTIPDMYSLPQMETILEQLEGKALFTTLDICWGYNNIRIKQDDQWKVAFTTPYGLYIPKVMPFGLRNTPATFQRCMHNTFRDILNWWPENIFIYMDDFLIATPNKTQQDIQLYQTIVHVVLQCFEDQLFFLKAAKCHFEQTCINYLGIIVEDSKITLDPVKQCGLLSWFAGTNARSEPLTEINQPEGL